MIKEKGKGKIIVFGILFWYPLAGVTYQFLHYLIGLKRLGYDPYYIEDSGRWVYDPKINDLSPDASSNISSVAPILESHGFSDRWAFRGDYPDGQCYGMTESQILQLYKEADAFLNVTGAQEIREEHMACSRRIYVESDPFVYQVKVANGERSTIEQLKRHDTFFTFGENVGEDDCDIPVERFRWLPTRQPVVMDLWNNPYGFDGSAYNTITTWHNKGKNIEYNGETYYWTKDREFEKFLELPRQRKVSFELATGVDEEVRRRLIENGWQQIDSVKVSKDMDSYRQYIQQSRGEFTVARDQYVRPNTGWFSDRSACYLAAGRPVITQETGFSKFLPTGKGLFSFKTMEDVFAAVDEIESDYENNCRAAREIAKEYFDSERVIGSLMARANL
ncbi:MAG: hypothetical protein H0X72_08340 [Acidobacteria bacterium]|jgi:hypothetical protein|nr:hypothetical protein [Acidobacteriota bacterium]MBA4182600.1 hypothetical protein [Acidobacteriota bacterium]